MSSSESFLPIYFYVPRDEVDSIVNQGYMSVRAQYEILHTMNPAKYTQQLNDALKQFPELQKRLHSIHKLEDRILEYLDWREEVTEQGSKAIYFLFQPITDDYSVRTFIHLYRDDFLEGRTLMRGFIDENVTPVYYVNGSAENRLAYLNSNWMKKQWQSQLSNHSTNQLWLENITHGFIIPKTGIIYNVSIFL
jgi:hypothetical protein